MTRKPATRPEEVATMLDIEGVANVRDVGGLPARSGSIRSGVLLRSGALGGLTERGQQQLAALGVGTVVDLRTTAEQHDAPTDLIGVEVVTLPMLQGAWDSSSFTHGRPDPDVLAASIPTLPRLYADMVADAGESFAAVARLVANASRPVLVHCTAGKDRTGVAVAILLDAVGADRPAIVADYALSHDNLTGPWADGMIARLSGLGIPDSPQLTELITASPVSAITAAMDDVDARGGSLRYLREHGLSADDAVRLHDRLVEH